MTDSPKTLPMANSIPAGINVDKIRRTIVEQGLVGASNNTKWNELIRLMRERSAQEKWVPSYRSKWLNGHISEWDCEWYYHLPFPFLGVLWLDISSLGNDEKDEADWLLPAIDQIGFEHEFSGGVTRIWGYLPRCHEDFPPR